MIREIFVTVSKTIAVLTDDKIDIDKDKRTAKALDILQKGCVACIGIVLSEAIAAELKATVFAPLSDDLSNMISYFLIGIFSALMIFVYNNITYRNSVQNAAMTAAYSGALINQFELYDIAKEQKIYENNVLMNCIENNKVSDAIQEFKERKNKQRGYFNEK